MPNLLLNPRRIPFPRLSAAILLAGAGCSSEPMATTSATGGAGGTPAGGCAAGQVACGDACATTASDVMNCGACGKACASGQSCVQGVCECQSSLVACEGTCVDLQSDAGNCGACGTSCASVGVCSVGRCVATCDAGLRQCGTSCVDVTTSIAHCGGCNAACPAGQQCTASSCTCSDAMQTLCRTSCVSLQTDPMNCGACDTQCTTGASCAAGVCSGGSGASSSTGGTPGTGGEASDTGGGDTGGASAGGGDTGGATTGGASAGGATTGGATTGGATTGGATTGGATTGGASAGGASAGGAGTGGTSTGGSNSCDDTCAFDAGIEWDCKKRFMYGVNFAWSSSDYFGADFGGISAWNRAGVSGNANAISQAFADFAQNGVNVVRWWIWPDFRSDGVNFSGVNATGIGGTFTADINRALELAEQHNLYLMLTLFSFDTFKLASEGGSSPNLHDIATNQTARSAFLENAVRPLARTVASSPNARRMLAWDIANEPELAMTGPSPYGDPDYTPQTFVDPITHSEAELFFGETIAVLRDESDALVTIGSAATCWQHAWTNIDIDFYQFHIYDWWSSEASSDPMDENQRQTKMQSYEYDVPVSEFLVNDKPIIMGEFPLTGFDAVDYATLVETWYKNGFAGVLGWSYSDQNFDWSGTRADVKAFADQHSCETQY